MPRLFICHDDRGNIVSVASVREMAPELAHPFVITDAHLSVIEVPDRDPVHTMDIEELQRTHTVDPRTGQVVAIPKTPAHPSRTRRPTNK